MKTTSTFLMLGFALLPLGAIAGTPAKPAPPTVQIYLADRSASIAEFKPPETMQPALLHCVNLAELSQQPVSIAVIFFGAGGVHVVGDEHGMPTAAYTTLRHELSTKWPKPDGETPMDAAFATAVKVVHALPRDAQVSVILMSDGEPSSGRLRPEDFPEIAAEMKRLREAVIKKYQGFPAEIVQHCVRDREQAWATPGTAEFLELYRKQVQAEFQRTLEHAAALAKDKVRFVTVDFAGGIPALRDIHQAAGGTAEDLVLTEPSAVIGKLHALGLTKLPRVVVPPPQSHDAQPNSFQSVIDVPVDQVGGAGIVTVEFRPAIVDFANNVFLTATVEGKELRFSPQSDNLQCQLAIDGKGNVATATLILDAIPKDGRVSIRYESPRGSLHVPACTIYTYLRLSENTTIDFRPSFTPPEALPPYVVSSNHRAVWTCALRTKGDPKPYPLRSVEAILCQTRSRAASRLEMKPDPQSPGVFASEETPLAAGCYDAELHLSFPSGAKFTVTLPRHIESVLRDEAIAMEVCQPAIDSRNPTGSLIGHIDFGPLGDKVTSKAVIIVIRSLETDYPITVAPSIVVADAQGTAPRLPWVVFDRPQVTLQPGRAERLRAVLTLPNQIEEAIQDGRFEGTLSLVRPDVQQPVPLKRYTKICGVDENEPVERVTFTLARPTMTITARHACRNRIKLTSDNKISLPIHISIGQPFQRTVTIEVSHDSVVRRDVTALPAAIFTDAGGREVPAVRLVPVADMPLTQQISPGDSGRWVFQFAVDNDCPTDTIFGTLDLSAPGMSTQHVSVLVDRRKPLLAATIRTACAILAALCAAFALQAIIRRFRARAFRTGQTHVLTPHRPLKGTLSVAAGRNGTVQLACEETMKVSRPGDSKPKLCAPQRPISIDPSEVTPSRPLRLEVCSPDGKPSQNIEITEFLTDEDGSPEAHLEVTSGEVADQQRARHARRVRSMLAVAAASGLLAATIGSPLVIASAQWLYDFFTFS